METLNALVCRAQLGDTHAYNAIVIRFQDMAFAYAYSFLKLDRYLQTASPSLNVISISIGSLLDAL